MSRLTCISSSGFLHGGDFHHVFIHLVTYALSCVLTPLDATECFIVGNEATVVAWHLRIYGENFDDTAALGADLFVKRWGFGLTLTTFHCGHDDPSLFLMKTLNDSTTAIIQKDLLIDVA